MKPVTEGLAESHLESMLFLRWYPCAADALRRSERGEAPGLFGGGKQEIFDLRWHEQPVVEVPGIHRVEVTLTGSGQGVGQEKAQSAAQTSGQGIAGLAALKVAASQADRTAQWFVDPGLGVR